MRLNLDIVRKMKSVKGKFGCHLPKFWPSTYGLNDKGRMNDDEFEKYVEKNVDRLHLDAEDTPGNWVIFKVDSSPSQMNVKLLIQFRANKLSGLFKNLYRCNLQRLTTEQLEKNESLSFNCAIISLLVFGRRDDVTGSEDYEDPFARAFSPDHNKGAWAAVGAAPVTRACLTHDMVCHDSKDGPKHVLYKKIQDSNDMACALLTARGFGGSNLQVQLKRNLLTPGTVTQPNSK